MLFASFCESSGALFRNAVKLVLIEMSFLCVGHNFFGTFWKTRISIFFSEIFYIKQTDRKGVTVDGVRRCFEIIYTSDVVSDRNEQYSIFYITNMMDYIHGLHLMMVEKVNLLVLHQPMLKAL